MEIKTNNKNLINFEKSDHQILLELFTELEILNKKGMFQEGSIEILGDLTAKPDPLLTNFLSKPQDILYFKSDREKKEALSLWDLYKETNDTHNSSFQIVGSSALYFLGYANLVEQLKKIRIKKNQKLLWDVLPLSIRDALKELCQKKGNDLDVRIQKNNKELLLNLLTKVDQWLIKKLDCFDQSFFMQNFYVQRCPIEKEKTLWTIQSFYYGNTTADYCQFIEAPRSYRFIKEALLLEMDLDKGEIEFKTQNPLIFIQSLLDVILKVSHSDLNNLLEDNDLGMLAYNQSRFHTCSRDEEEENLIKLIFTDNKESNTTKLEKILKTTHKKHSQKSLCALVCLLLNSLRICAPYINEEELVNAMKQELSFSEKKSYIHTLCEMLLKKISFEKISSLVQVVAFAALHHHKGSINKKRICLVKHRDVEHLQIGSENSILLKWNIQKSLKVVEEHFNPLSPFFSSCLLNLIKPLDLSAHEIFFIAAYEAGEFELAFTKFSLLNNKQSYALLGRVFSNPKISLKEKNIYLSKTFSIQEEENLSVLLMDLNCFFGKCELIPDISFPDLLIEKILKNKEHYPHLISAIPLRKIHLVWQKKFQNVKENQDKLRFFIQAIQFYHQFKIPHQLEAITLSNPCNIEPFLKIDSKSSYIHTLCEMLLKSIDLEKISAALQIAFFVSMYESPSSSTNKSPNKFELVQIGKKNAIFLKCNIKKAIQVVESHFELLSDFLPQFTEEQLNLSAEEILFIAAYEAKEMNCASKMSKQIKVSERHLERFLSNSHIAKNQKISYLLGVLKLKNTSVNISSDLSILNTLLMQAKRNAYELDLAPWCIEFIWKNQDQYPHILSQFSEKMLKEIHVKDFNSIKNLKDQFLFIKEKINFYKSKNISIDFQDLTIPLYSSLYKKSFSNEALLLRQLYKNNKDVQLKMPEQIELNQKSNKKTTPSIKNKDFAGTLHFIHSSQQSQKTQLLKEHDPQLSKQLCEMNEKSLDKLNWDILKPYLKELPQTKLALDQKLGELCQKVSSSKEIELLQYHSKCTELLFRAAKQVKNNVFLSKKCFELILNRKSNQPLKEEVDLIDLFSAYKEELYLFWLLENLPPISKLFSTVKEEYLLKSLDETVKKLIPQLLTSTQIQKFLNVLFLNDIWTPFSAECFTYLYVKLKEENQPFIHPKKENCYKNLIKNISNFDLLTKLYDLFFKETSFEEEIFFIQRVKTLIEHQIELKKEKPFLEFEVRVKIHFSRKVNHFLEKGSSRKNWRSLVQVISEISPHLQEKSKIIIENTMSAILFHLALFENDLNVFNELYRIHIKNKNTKDIISFLQTLCSNIKSYLSSPEIEKNMLSYQNTNSIKLPPQVKTRQELDPLKSIHSNLINVSKDINFSKWIKFEDKELNLPSNDILNTKLKIFYLKLKELIIDLIKKDSSLSDCILLASSWTFNQLEWGDKCALDELVLLKEALFEKIKKEKLEKTLCNEKKGKKDRIRLVKLAYAAQILENKKEYKKHESEILLFKSIEKKLDVYCFELILDVSLFKNALSHSFIYKCFKKNNITSFIEKLHEHYQAEWLQKNRFQITRTLIIQMLLKHFENINNPIQEFLLLPATLLHLYEALKTYFILNKFDPSIQTLLDFRLITGALYEITMKFYFKEKKAEPAKKLSLLYYETTNEGFLRSLQSEDQFKLFNYTDIAYINEVIQVFSQLVKSPLKILAPQFWKEKIDEWQEWPDLLLTQYSEYRWPTRYPNLYHSICQNFVHLLNENKIEITDETLKKIIPLKKPNQNKKN